MTEDTFTFTARCRQTPDKLATFTLQNGHAQIELGNSLIEKVNRLIETVKGEDSLEFKQLLQPVATGAVQRLVQPIPLQDFEATVSDGKFQVTGWLRSAGLRVAPIIVTWNEIDNPPAAMAFVHELEKRKKEATSQKRFPGFLDYWASWATLAVAGISIPIYWLKRNRPQEITA